MASQSENPPMQSRAVEMTLVLLLKGMTGSFARNIESRGLASSSSLSAKDSATAYQACRQASSGGHCVGLFKQPEIAESRCCSREWSSPSLKILKLYMMVSAISVL